MLNNRLCKINTDIFFSLLILKCLSQGFKKGFVILKFFLKKGPILLLNSIKLIDIQSTLKINTIRCQTRKKKRITITTKELK